MTSNQFICLIVYMFIIAGTLAFFLFSGPVAIIYYKMMLFTAAVFSPLVFFAWKSIKDCEKKELK